MAAMFAAVSATATVCALTILLSAVASLTASATVSVRAGAVVSVKVIEPMCVSFSGSVLRPFKFARTLADEFRMLMDAATSRAL